MLNEKSYRVLGKVYISLSLQKRFRLENFGVSRMSWKDLVCLCVIITGVVLFLYGANCFDALIGWAGIFLVIAGFLAKIVLIVWETLRKKDDG